VTTAGLEPATFWFPYMVTSGDRSQTRYHCAR